MSAVTGSMFELLYGGSFQNFRPERLDATAIADLGDNILYQSDAKGRYGIKISGTAYEFAHVADLADFATETFVNDAVSALETSILGGVAADGDTLAKLRALISGLESSKGAATDVAQLQTDVANIQTLLSSDDTTLDELQEVVDFIKANKSTLDALSIANIAGLQAALDGKVDNTTYQAFVTSTTTALGTKVDQTAYDARVTAVDTALGTKVDQTAYDTKVSEIEGRLTTNEADIDALQAAVQSFTNSSVSYVEATVTGTGTAVSGGYEYSAAVPATKKIVTVLAEADGKNFGSWERVDAQTIKVTTVGQIGASQVKFYMGYIPQ